jgi:hypothetical protein
MIRQRPLFITGVARSGSTLLCRMLSVNKEIIAAASPYLPFFHSLRNAAIRTPGNSDASLLFDPSSAFQDYYFTDERIQVMDAVQNGYLSLPYNQSEWSQFYVESLNRVQQECSDLAPHLAEMRATTYEGMLDSGLNIIAKARNAQNCSWVGFKEVWIVEFFTLLAKTYPQAKFIILHRDPRGVINSHLRGVKKDTAAASPALSYARHWRKYAAFTLHFQRSSLFSDRLYVMNYEDLLEEPEKKAKELCDFLEVGYDSAMLDTNNYYNFATSAVWKGNSSFEETTTGISTRQAERWITTLDPKAIKMVDFVCGPEMELVGYEPMTPFADEWPDPEVLEYFIQDNRDHKEYCNWRSDFDDPQQDYGFELFRRALLALPDHYLDVDMVRRSFLFEDVFTELRRRVGMTGQSDEKERTRADG